MAWKTEYLAPDSPEARAGGVKDGGWGVYRDHHTKTGATRARARAALANARTN